MKTVLGLSVTAARVGWVLVDGITPVDDDKFAVRDVDDLVSRCLAAVRGAQSIATSSGRRIESLGICWSRDVEERVDTLLTELRAAGCTDVRSVRQVTPVAAQESEGPVAERAERVDPCGLFAQLLAGETNTDFDVEDLIAFDEHDVTSAPDAGTTSAYDAAQAVVTNAAPPETVTIVGPGRNWTPAASGTRVASAAAVTAVVALFAVGSQSIGPGDTGVQEAAALANWSSDSTAQITQIVHPVPLAAQLMVAATEPAQTSAVDAPMPLAVPPPADEAVEVAAATAPAEAAAAPMPLPVPPPAYEAAEVAAAIEPAKAEESPEAEVGDIDYDKVELALEGDEAAEAEVKGWRSPNATPKRSQQKPNSFTPRAAGEGSPDETSGESDSSADSSLGTFTP
ncbi:MAG: hypothetical protein WBO08_15715 [Mycobacterium sp.]